MATRREVQIGFHQRFFPPPAAAAREVCPWPGPLCPGRSNGPHNVVNVTNVTTRACPRGLANAAWPPLPENLRHNETSGPRCTVPSNVTADRQQ